MSGNLSFDANSVAPQASFQPIPAGTYTVTVTDSEVKPTKSGTGTMANFTLQVVDGQFAGRKLFARMNVRNSNPEAERIGQSQLSALCHAGGVLQLSDTGQLHGATVKARVKIRTDPSGAYEPSNDVVGFEAIGAGSSPARQAQPAQQQPSAATGAASPPWAKARATA